MTAIQEATEYMLQHFRNPGGADAGEIKRLIGELRAERGDLVSGESLVAAEEFGFTGQFAAGDVACSFEHGRLVGAVELTDAEIPEPEGPQVEIDESESEELVGS